MPRIELRRSRSRKRIGVALAIDDIRVDQPSAFRGSGSAYATRPPVITSSSIEGLRSKLLPILHVIKQYKDLVRRLIFFYGQDNVSNCLEKPWHSFSLSSRSLRPNQSVDSYGVCTILGASEPTA